ncbi:response regulator transcription factor [Corynebacterium canis]|uniref:Response regulator transcription factor n=1 Tax=Corynebacterium canis TaxID=679663 RepID=A0A5C5TY95_9CORY|nr:response regulator transcription factor [Corynebacterium canis]TWT18255.1 response regulator transcription factor [Corynebacterium canis]WJY75103.1 Transcriptional regulatory protein LiaR [Corynebacterium canis]
MIRVALVDDQPLVRSGFAMLVNSQPDLEVVWQAGDGSEVFAQPPADVVLMDVQMPNMDGITAAAQLLAKDTDVRIIMLTTFDDRDYVTDAIAAGASGFLLKDAEPEELLKAIRVVAAGEAVLAPRVTAKLLTEFIPRPAVPVVHCDDLTPREVEVLRLMAFGYSNTEIAKAHVVSMATVKTHVRHILMKLGARDRVHAVLYAYRTGLVSQEELLSQE